jgi:hypothetical protein
MAGAQNIPIVLSRIRPRGRRAWMSDGHERVGRGFGKAHRQTEGAADGPTRYEAWRVGLPDEPDTSPSEADTVLAKDTTVAHGAQARRLGPTRRHHTARE